MANFSHPHQSYHRHRLLKAIDMKIRVLLAKQGLINALVLLYINSYFSTVSTNGYQLCNSDDETISVCHEDRQRFVHDACAQLKIL